MGPLVPLVFARSGKTHSHFALVPLIWHFADRAADQDDHGRRAVLAPPLGQRDHRRPVPAALLPAGRAPGRQRRDQLHALPAGALPARCAHARVRHAAGRVGARARAQRRLPRPLLLVRRQGAVAALHPVPAHRRDRSRDGGADPAIRAVVPGRRAQEQRARADPAVRALHGRARDRHLGGAHLLPHAPEQRRSRRRAAAALLAIGVRRSADDGDRPLLRPHRAGGAQLRLRAAVLPRAQSGAQHHGHPAAADGPPRRGQRRAGLAVDLALRPQARPRHQPRPRCFRCSGRTSAAAARPRSGSRSTGTSPTRTRIVPGPTSRRWPSGHGRGRGARAGS